MLALRCPTAPVFNTTRRQASRHVVRVKAAQQAGTQAIIVKRQASEADLKAKGVRSWPTWGCEASKFPWSYSDTEEAFLLEGKVTVTPDGGEPVDLQAGDFAVFPAGMSCTWDVKQAIKKHYNFR